MKEYHLIENHTKHNGRCVLWVRNWNNGRARQFSGYVTQLTNTSMSVNPYSWMNASVLIFESPVEAAEYVQQNFFHSPYLYVYNIEDYQDFGYVIYRPHILNLARKFINGLRPHKGHTKINSAYAGDVYHASVYPTERKALNAVQKLNKFFAGEFCVLKITAEELIRHTITIPEGGN